MNELHIVRKRKCISLNLSIWCEDTGYTHTNLRLCYLNNSEVNFQGGRFRRYQPDLRANRITIPLFKNGMSIFQPTLDWLAENVETGWSMSFTDAEPISIAGGIGPTCVEVDLHLYFEDADDAMLCLLKFR